MNILAIGAHYDDVELGCGGTLLNHVKQGDRVTVAVVTDSGYAAPDGRVIRSAETAEKEGREAADRLGAELLSLGEKTFHVTGGEALTARLFEIIEERNIGTIYAHWSGDLHRDHRKAAEAALMAGRHVPRYLMYCSNYYQTGTPFRGNFYSDISAVMAEKLRLVKTHKSELGRVEERWIRYLENHHENAGMAIGVRYAETFQAVRWLMGGGR